MKNEKILSIVNTIMNEKKVTFNEAMKFLLATEAYKEYTLGNIEKGKEFKHLALLEINNISEETIKEKRRHYLFEDFDVTALINEKIRNITVVISEMEHINVLDSYQKFAATTAYKNLTNGNSLLWAKQDHEVYINYYNEVNKDSKEKTK